MLLEDNSLNVLNLMKYFDDLNNVDKIRLAINILENKDFTINCNIDNIDNIVIALKQVLAILDPNCISTITNFSKYENLVFLSAKNMELDCKDKKRFSIELLFNIFQTDFKNETINKLINEKLDIYGYYYSLYNIK